MGVKRDDVKTANDRERGDVSRGVVSRHCWDNLQLFIALFSLLVIRGSVRGPGVPRTTIARHPTTSSQVWQPF